MWPWNWCIAWLHVECATFQPILVFLGLFGLDLGANNYQTHQVILQPWSLTLEVMALVLDSGLRVPSVHQVWRIVCIAFPFGRFDTLSMTALIDLVTFWPLLGSRVTRMGFHPRSSFRLLRPFRFRVRSKNVTERQTYSSNSTLHFIMPQTYGDRGHNKAGVIVLWLSWFKCFYVRQLCWST